MLGQKKTSLKNTSFQQVYPLKSAKYVLANTSIRGLFIKGKVLVFLEFFETMTKLIFSKTMNVMTFINRSDKRMNKK